jgi:DNA-binding NtrC family response regulator
MARDTSHCPVLRVLVADDEPDVRAALRLLLRDAGFEIGEADSPAAALAAVAGDTFDVVLLDLNYTGGGTSGREGLDLLPRLREIDPCVSVVVITAWGTVTSAVEAMRRGARDYVEKPWTNERLLTVVRSHAEFAHANRRSRLSDERDQRAREGALPPFIATGSAMQRVRELVERVAASDASVLVTGEHGTGKEVVARWLHARSRRCDKPFVTLNAGGLADGVFESECFGHTRGAFTDAKTERAGCFELAHGGTLFLDEIGNMPSGQQAKLLRVLETGELQRVGSSRVLRVDVRVVTATNASLEREVEVGRFRADLLYRLNTVEIALPPLRERREEIVPLAEHFLRRYASHYDRLGLEFTPCARSALEEHPWLGNVRELSHVVERAVILAQTGAIDAGSLLLPKQAPPSVSLAEVPLAEAERRLVENALERCQGNVSETARALGLSRSALYRRLERIRKD